MKKVPFQTAAPILNQFELSEALSIRIDPNAPPIEVVGILAKHKAYLELANFWAHALPMREAVWWACQALNQRADVWQVPEQRVIAQVMAWVKSPNESIRRQLELAIAPMPNESAAKWLGQAVFWSGTGSIAPIDSPAVMPIEFLYAKAVAGSRQHCSRFTGVGWLSSVLSPCISCC